jgi:surface carbohydrate biosynthesis protein
MVSKKKVVILYTINQFEKYALLEENFYEDDSVIIVALTLELMSYLKNRGIKFRVQDDYLTEIEADDRDDYAFDIVRKWHKDLFKFQGVSLGLLAQWDLNFYFSRIIKVVSFILNLIEVEKPDEIVFFKVKNRFIIDFNNILNLICSRKKVDVNPTSIDKPEQSNMIKVKPGFREALIDLVSPIIESKPFKFCTKAVLRVLWILHNIKTKLFYEQNRRILTINNEYHPSVAEVGYRNKIFYRFNNRIDISIIIKLYQNLKYVVLNKKGGYHIFLEMYESNKIRKQADSFLNKFLNHWKKIIEESSFKEIFTYKGISLWSIIENKIYSVISTDFKEFIKNIIIFQKILYKNKIDLVMLSNEVREESMSLAIISSKKQIPSIVIQHGITSLYIGYVPSVSKKFAAWGQISKDFIIKYGMEKNKIELTGCPRFDAYIYLNRNNQLKNKIKEAVNQRFGISKDKKLILQVSSHAGIFYRLNSDLSAFEVMKSYDCALDMIQTMSDSHLIIKLHPLDPTQGKYVIDLIKKRGIKNASVTLKSNIVELIVACDCFITGESTTALEAMLLEKPVIFLHFRKRDYHTPYIEYFSESKASSQLELTNLIRKSIKEPVSHDFYHKFLKKYLYKIDGLSTMRVLELIGSLI